MGFPARISFSSSSWMTFELVLHFPHLSEKRQVIFIIQIMTSILFVRSLIILHMYRNL